jgi:hypothetical protein
MLLVLKYDSCYVMYTVGTGLMTLAEFRLPVSAAAGSVVRRVTERENLLAAIPR